MFTLNRFAFAFLLIIGSALAQKPTQVVPGQLRGSPSLMLFACGVPPAPPAPVGSGPSCALVTVPGITFSYVAGVPTVSFLTIAPPNPIQRDVFQVNCSTSTNCASGAPALSYKLTGPVANLVYVTRNGMVMSAVDYVGPDPTGIITFVAGQAPQDGDLIVGAYFAR